MGMRRQGWLVITLLAVSPAAAQSFASPREEALATKLMREVNDAVSCELGAVAARRRIEELEAQVKDLQGKTKEGAK